MCKQEDINENEMKLLPLGDDGKKILLVKQKGELHAIGTKCTHYGALLHTGALGEGRVRCPWHGACFNIKTGDIEDYPGLDSLPCYKVLEYLQAHRDSRLHYYPILFNAVMSFLNRCAWTKPVRFT